MTLRPTSVRVAIPRDERRILDILHLAHEENAVAPISERKVIEAIQKGTRPSAERGYGIIGVIDGPNSIEGIIMMMMCQWWYSDAWHIEEYCNFVHPQHRNSPHAKDLINFGRWSSEQMSMPLFMGILTSTRMAAKIRFYRRQLIQRGAMFVHNANYGALNNAPEPEEVMNDKI